MSFFESLLILMAVAILLLQVSRRLQIPYPTMLAAAGVGLAMIPGAPKIMLDPHMALALFIAPVLVDAAFDFPVGAIRKLWRPLVTLAVAAVFLSAGAVAWLGVAYAGLPIYAAIALGAIVAPPDAAAATAILSNVRMPRRTVAVLKGESLLNDASALLLFTAATTFHVSAGLDGTTITRLALAAPGGIALGIVLALVSRRLTPFTAGTLGGNLFEFITTFGVWVIAERLGLSAVLCLVAFAMTIARSAGLTTKPRSRIHSFAVWGSAVFLLNVLAFLLMGFQARTIVAGMTPDRLREAAWFALAVIVTLIVVRMVGVLIYNRVAARFTAIGGARPATFRQGVLIGWCGMRGLVTLATAFALPASFPQRDLIVLTAFAVVLATLVIQGMTLAPLVRLLKLDGEDGLADELATARVDLAGAALATLEGKTGPAADHWRYRFEDERSNPTPTASPAPSNDWRAVGLIAIHRQRERLEELRAEQRLGADAFLVIQEELDFEEVSLSGDDEREMKEA